MSTTECSWRLCPTPGMYAVTSMPLVRRTRATLRRAELGFFGVVVYTRVHTPRRCGEPFSAGVLVLPTLSWRPLRTSWLIVGNLFSVPGLVVLSRRTRRDGTPWCFRYRPPHSGVSEPVLSPALPTADFRRRSGVRCPARGWWAGLSFPALALGGGSALLARLVLTMLVALRTGCPDLAGHSC